MRFGSGTLNLKDSLDAMEGWSRHTNVWHESEGEATVAPGRRPSSRRTATARPVTRSASCAIPTAPRRRASGASAARCIAGSRTATTSRSPPATAATRWRCSRTARRSRASRGCSSATGQDGEDPRRRPGAADRPAGARGAPATALRDRVLARDRDVRERATAPRRPTGYPRPATTPRVTSSARPSRRRPTSASRPAAASRSTASTAPGAAAADGGGYDSWWGVAVSAQSHDLE